MFEFVAIVGGPTYPRLGEVTAYIAALPKTAIVVTSADRGVDRFVASAARDRGLGVLVFDTAAPDFDPRIADVCHRLVVFSSPPYGDRAVTVERAAQQGKPVDIRRPR